jgi:hypothetical protein
MRAMEGSYEREPSNSKGRFHADSPQLSEQDEGNGNRCGNRRHRPEPRLTHSPIMRDTLVFTRQLPRSANKDFISLFNAEAAGHVLKYFYLYPSDYDTNLLPQQDRYYVFNEDVRLIQELCKACAANEIDFAVSKAVVDLGPGDINAFSLKTKPILDISPQAEWYIAVDYSSRVLLDLKNSLDNFIGSYLTAFVCSDFHGIYPCKFLIHNSIVLLLGHTIGSLPTYKPGYFPDAEYVDFLKTLRGCFPEGTQFLMTLDRCMDWSEVLDCYSSELTYNFFRRGYSGMFLGQDASPAEVFETEIRVDPTASCICFDLRVRKDAAIHFWDRSITVSRNHRFTLGTSYRFSLEKAISLLRQAGFPSTQQIEFSDSHVVLLLAK